MVFYIVSLLYVLIASVIIIEANKQITENKNHGKS